MGSSSALLRAVGVGLRVFAEVRTLPAHWGQRNLMEPSGSRATTDQRHLARSVYQSNSFFPVSFVGWCEEMCGCVDVEESATVFDQDGVVAACGDGTGSFLDIFGLGHDEVPSLKA